MLGLLALLISARFPLSVFWHDAFSSHVSQDRVTAAATSAPPPSYTLLYVYLLKVRVFYTVLSSSCSLSAQFLVTKFSQYFFVLRERRRVRGLRYRFFFCYGLKTMVSRGKGLICHVSVLLSLFLSGCCHGFFKHDLFIFIHDAWLQADYEPRHPPS